MEQPNCYTPKDIEKGQKSYFEIRVTLELINSFSKLSGDWNPLHNDLDYAKSKGYSSVIAHGALQQALISRLMGMYLPGQYCLIKKVQTQYIEPVFPNELLRLEAEVVRWDPGLPGGEISVTISCGQQKKSISLLNVGLVGYLKTSQIQSESRQRKNLIGSTRKDLVKNTNKILLLGGESGLASALIPQLRESGFHPLKVSRQLDADLTLDFSVDESESLINYAMSQNVYAVLHFAAQRPIKSPPSKLDIPRLNRDIQIHLSPLKQLARAVIENKLPNLGRIIIFTSSWGKHLFPERGYEAYAYVKTLSMLYLKDLARELAGSAVTLNAIAPSEMALGMNAGMAERMQKMVATKNPSGKMTNSVDIYRTIDFLLSENSSQITGQEFILAGGRIL